MLAIEMVMSQRPVLGLLDEPSAALADTLAATFLVRLSNQIKETRCSYLLVEQNEIAIAESGGRTLLFRDGMVF